MNHLLIDIETYSDRDLKQCGVYKYAESPTFEILLFGISVDGGPVKVYDINVSLGRLITAYTLP